MVTRILPKTEVRDRIRQELAELGDDSLVITERGRPLAVVVSVERWNELQQQLEDLADAVAVLEHRLAPEAGQPAEQVFDAIEREWANVHGPSRQTG